MDPVWLDSYPDGVPESIELDPEESLVDLLMRACERFAHRPAFTSLGHSINYAELERMTARFAAYLQHCQGLARGDRVALMMPNVLQYPIALFGALRAGMVVVNVNPLYTSRELEHQLVNAGVKAIVVVASSAAELEEVIERTPIEHVIVTNVGDLLPLPRRLLVNFVVKYIKRMVRSWRLSGARGFRQVMTTDPAGFEPVDVTGADLAFLQYTGGTTGRAKGAMLSHGNLVANVRQINAWFKPLLEPATEIVITALPLYHVYALTCNCLCYLDVGGRDVLIIDPRDTREFIREMKKWKFTAITGVNTLYQSLVDHSDIEDVDFSELKVVSAGGMAVMEFTAREWSKKTGTEILEGYGLSETSPVVTTNPYDLEAYSGSIGLPVPSTEISLRDDDGREVAEGEPGELCVRGPQVTSGYWQNAEATDTALTQDGFFQTGDIATVDARGYFQIVDRKKDMILVSGFNVYPNEVEQVVTQHPDIVEAACIGVPDSRTTEAVKVFAVLKKDATLTAEDLRDYCHQQLAGYKVPKHVEFRESLPKSNVGKILRRELREDAG